MMSSTATDQFAYHRGRTVGRYKLEELLGRGATAEVYKSVHPDLQRNIAIKILHPFQSHDSGFVQRFQNEAKAVATLIHPNIVQVYDFNVTEDSLYYITMQYVDGPTLDEYMDLKQSPLPLSKALHIFNQVAQALQFAHQRGIIHRDIKPANIMLDSRGDAYLGDFGFAQIIGVELHTQSSVTPGTPIFMAPEQITSSKVTAVADIYALGVILYQMLTAKIPYYGDNLMTVILRKLDEPPESPRHYNPDLPVHVEHVIMKAMAREPAERYQTVASMIAGLQEAVLQSAESGVNVSALLGMEGVSVPQRQVEGYKIQREFSADEMRSYQRYLAKDLKRKQRVIITVLRQNSTDPETADTQFQERSRHLLKLKNQPGLAQARQTGFTSDKRPYLAYDYVPGQQLSILLKERQKSGAVAPAETSLRLIRGLATSLVSAQRVNLIHHDLRPEHILLDKENKPTIVGLEIPKSPNIALPKYWDELSYTPPEQIKERDVTLQGNVYSLGVILYELLANQRPQVASHALLEVDDDFIPTAVPLHHLNDRLTQTTYHLVSRCLARWEAERFDTLDNLISHLDQAIADEKKISAAEAAGVSPATPEDPPRRRLWAAVPIAVLLIALVALLAWTQLAQPGDAGLAGADPVSTPLSTEPLAEPIVAASLPEPVNESNAAATVTIESIPPTLTAVPIDETAVAANAEEARNALATAAAVEARADASARLATGRELAADAISQLSSDPQLSLLLGLEAISLTAADEQAPPGEVIEALYRALSASTQAFTLASHTAEVNDTAVSADGRWLATASDDTTVKLWDAVSGQEVTTFNEHTNPVTSLAFSPDSIYLAAGSDDSRIFIWNIESGALVRALIGEDDGGVRAVAFHPDGQRLGVGYQVGTARVWNVTDGTPLLRQFEHSGPINDVVFSPDGSLFATAGADGLLVTQNANTGRPIFSYFPEQYENGNPIAINSMAYNADGSQIIMAKDNGRVLIWEGETLLATLSGHSGKLLDVAMSADGKWLATASTDGSAKLWQIESQKIIQTFSGHAGAVTAVKFTPAADQIVTTSLDGTARIWNIGFDLEPLILSEHEGGINSVSYNADGTMLVTGGNDQSARIWDAATGELLQTLWGHDRPVTTAEFHPQLPILASASLDTNVRLWNLETGEVHLPFYFHQTAVNDLDFNGDGSLLATAAADGLVRIWDTATDTVLFELPHEEAVQAVAFSPDGSQLVSTSDDTAVIWDMASGESGQQFSSHNGLIHDAAFSPDGSLLATARADGVVKLWDTMTGETVRTFSGHSGPVLWLDFSPDGRQLATSSVDKTAKLWDTETGQVIRTFLGHTAAVNAVAFNPNNSSLATASLDSTAQLIPLMNTEELINQAWRHLTRPLSAEECTQYLADFPCQTTSLDNAPATTVP